jgi:hypothetical protein
MVTVTIMLIMAAVVFFNYGKFNESSLMNQIAYDLSLTIRQAQVYGVAAKQGAGSQSDPITTANADSNNFKSAYGVHFDISNNGDPTKFELFIDIDKSGTYNTGDTILQTYTFQREITIKALCFDVINTNPPNTCESGITTNGQKAQILDITFTRPNPEAKIQLTTPNQIADSVNIYLHNVDDNIIKSVVVYSTGQISVQ